MTDLKDWPKHPTLGGYWCTEDHPMPEDAKDSVPGWIHQDVREIFDAERRVEYFCENCGHTFWVDFGD